MATFAEQMVEGPPNATCRVWSLSPKYRTLLADSAGLKTVTVDGQSVTYGELEERLRHWDSRVASGIASVDLLCYHNFRPRGGARPADGYRRSEEAIADASGDKSGRVRGVIRTKINTVKPVQGTAMKQAMIVSVCVLITFALIGCSKKQSRTPVGKQDRTIPMGSETLFKSGNYWVFRFKSGGSTCFIVGDNVAFGSRQTDHVVVQLDSHLSLNVPTGGQHRVLRVDQHGFTEVEIDPDQSATLKELLQEVVTAKKGPA